MVAQPKVEQIILFDDSDDWKEYRRLAMHVKKKRVRFKRPTYTKSYEFWHINPLTGEVEYNGDERHIFRVKSLQKIHAEIFTICINKLGLWGDFERRDATLQVNNVNNSQFSTLNSQLKLVFWGQEKQAEIQDSEWLPIKDRVLLHVKLLRALRKTLNR